VRAVRPAHDEEGQDVPGDAAAGGAIRVVLVEEGKGWLAYFCTDPGATAEEVLEAADRGAHEQAFKDLKEVYGAGQQQVRNIDSNVGAFCVNGWLYSLTEAWSWSPWSTTGRCPWACR
jgi:hypothetical protein